MTHVFSGCAKSLFVFITKLSHVYSQDKTVTHYCFTKLFISLYFVVLYFFRIN
jgi:hypothetical protein